MLALQRAIILLQQSRYDLAERELRRAVAAEPNNPVPRALLAECLVELKRLDEATEEAREAIRLAPDFPLGYYALARVLHHRNRLDEAVAAIEEAIRLDPEDADYFATLASIRYSQERWRDALDAADQGLALDAEHTSCGNLRAMALVRLGRQSEAGLTIDAQLARDPENALTHSNRGWALMHQADYPRALEHFREALRLDPELEWAREGIVQALKAKYPLYGLMLRYFLWTSRLSGRAQWGLIIGGYLGYRFVLNVSRASPALSPFLTPLLVVYGLFVLLTWIADPLFNLALRLNQFGRLCLSAEQTTASTLVGGLLLAALATAAAALAAGSSSLLLGAVALVGLTVPTSALFNCQVGWPRVTMIAVASLLALVVAAGILFMVAAPTSGAGGALVGIALLGVFLSSWIATPLANVRPRR